MLLLSVFLAIIPTLCSRFRTKEHGLIFLNSSTAFEDRRRRRRMSDIRKWFVKKHDKDDGNAANPASSTKVPLESAQPAKSDEEQKDHESAVRRKTSKYFSSDSKKEKDEMKAEEVIAKRKFQPSSLEMHSDVKPPPRKKVHKIEDEGDDDDDDDFVETATRRADVTPNKKLKNGSGKGIVNKSMDVDGSDEDYSVAPKSHSKTTSGRGRTAAKATCMDVDGSDGDDPDIKDMKSSKSAGRGRGRRATTAAPSSGRGRGGGGRGGYMNFADRKDPPHKGEKEIPEGSPDCLANLTFVISGTLDSLEREEAEELIKRHSGRVTGSVSKKTNYLLCDEDIGGRKSAKAQELGTTMLTEDGLFDMIRRSNKSNSTKMEESPNSVGKVHPSPSKMSTTTPETKKNQAAYLSVKGAPAKENKAGATTPLKPKTQSTEGSSLQWTEKHRPKVPNDIIGNQSLVKQLHDWLLNWNGQFLGNGSKTKGKKPNDAGAKKAVLLSGTPGIGKTTAARLVSQMLGFITIEVNASDSRGKADAKIGRGIGGSTANTMKELISNEALSRSMERSRHPKTVLIMDEVDGMSAGDRGGVADLISSIKSSKIPIICICNDRYSQKLKSLVNYCLLLSFRKPTKQQMAKRLMQIASAEGLQANEIALEELAERVNGDMRLALNQLQYMSVSMSVIKYDDIRQRLQFSSKDEDISPFTAVDKLFGFNSVKLRMDERIDLSMSDPDLVPLLIQENYINYRPSSAAKDDNGVKRMELIARAAESIADGDIINVQIRRYRQWQLFQSSSIASSIIPASLLHGQRETLEQGERNFNRFGGWLGKNSTMGKNYRLLEDLHVHILASRESYLGRTTLRLDYLTILLKQLTDTLRFLPKDEAVEKVVEFMDTYSISQEDFDTIVEISKFQGRPSSMEGIPPAVKAALTKAYKKGSSSRVIRTADMITLPGIKKAVKKRVTAMLEPEGGGLAEDIEDEVEVNGEENSSDSEDDSDREKKLMSGLQSLNLKGVQVQMELKGVGSSGVKKASGRGRGSSQGGGGGGGGRGSGLAAAASKRKR